MNMNSDELSGIQSELHNYREKCMEEYLTHELGHLTDEERAVLSSISNNTLLAENLNATDDAAQFTYAQRLSDKLALFGGSWTYIIYLVVILIVWIGINCIWLLNKGFDPYPFILLNLILSCMQAIQAPVIMMSQNRKEDKDRLRGKKDYMINLKSEFELRMLQEKIDQMMLEQQEKLIGFQQQQLDLLNQILHHTQSKNK